MVAQMILDHLVWVRALVPEPNGPMVKWLRRCPLKAEAGVQIPLALPVKPPEKSGGFLYLYDPPDLEKAPIPKPSPKPVHELPDPVRNSGEHLAVQWCPLRTRDAR